MDSGSKARSPPGDDDQDLLSSEWSDQVEEDIFFIKAASQSRSEEVYFTEKRGGDEVTERDIPAEEWPEWITSDSTEWDGVKSTGGVRVLSLEESRNVREASTRQGKENRIIPSRMVRRKKPSEK
eukprot:1197699-Pyramimonas_sp.AAC.1